MAAPARVPTPAPEPPAPPPPPAPIVEEPEPAPPPTPMPVSARHRPSATKRWFLGLTMGDRSAVTSFCELRAARSCHIATDNVLPPPPADDPDPPQAAEPEVDPDEAKVARLPSDKVAAYCRDEIPAPTCETPLVVAFEGQPVDFVAAGGDAFAFVPGEPAATDWPSQATPWIALDLDGDGAITSGAELFGSSTVLANGAHAANGFEALAALDANRDRVLDARDPMFSRLVLWTDRNGDHRSTPDELRRLDATVTAIALDFTRDPRCNQRDDCEGERSTLRWRDALGTEHVGAVVDVYLPRRR